MLATGHQENIYEVEACGNAWTMTFTNLLEST